jgi:hypothetical protein
MGMTNTTSQRGRWWQVLCLLLLAPICAEYLWAYDDSTGRPDQLIGNLIIFVPLYGCAALLIREVARRAQLGWIGILLLAAAFGVIEAGLVDQSLFSPNYRGLEGWEETYGATLITPLGVSAANLIGFVGGHVIMSIAAPIALVEAFRPAAANTPWLRMPGLVITAVLYVAASIFVLVHHLQTETWHASAGQLVGAAIVTVALIMAAVLVGRRPRASRPVPGPGLTLTGSVAVVLALAYAVTPQTWTGVVISVAIVILAGVLLTRSSRSQGWSPTHAAVVAAAPLLVTAVLAFTYDPMLGDVGAQAKYAHNVVMLTIVLDAVGVVILRRRSAALSQSAAHHAPRATGSREKPRMLEPGRRRALPASRSRGKRSASVRKMISPSRRASGAPRQ